jgi:hypothetical protein
MDEQSALFESATSPPEEGDGVMPAGDAIAPASLWERESVNRALDELFSLTQQYRSSANYHELMKFIARFRFYSPFNAMLVHIQMSGASFVAPAARWLKLYQRRIRAGARPLVILQPMGPVMFVFDVSDTDPGSDAPPLPPEVTNPFEVRKGQIRSELRTTIDNAKRDGISVTEQQAGSQRAGSIQPVKPGRSLEVLVKQQPKPEYVTVPLRYELLTNSSLSAEARYATLVHELAHLYCGHLGNPNDKWWPDRRGLNHEVCEFEAESITYLICMRLGIDNPSEQYLASFVQREGQVPTISLECVMKAAGLIEQMGRQRLTLRKDKQTPTTTAVDRKE